MLFRSDHATRGGLPLTAAQAAELESLRQAGRGRREEQRGAEQEAASAARLEDLRQFVSAHDGKLPSVAAEDGAARKLGVWLDNATRGLRSLHATI